MRILPTLLLLAATAFAHCDRMDGPVVKAARQALETGEVHRALIWVRAQDEPEVKAAFQKAVHDKGNQQAFFETVVRLHRAGEGAPFEGVKPAGGALSPGIAAADAAAESGSPEPVLRVLREAVEQRVQALNDARKYRPDDVAAGREYVRAYVEFVHFVERLAPVHEH
jgi:hypothetical protein